LIARHLINSINPKRCS